MQSNLHAVRLKAITVLAKSETLNPEPPKP